MRHPMQLFAAGLALFATAMAIVALVLAGLSAGPPVSATSTRPSSPHAMEATAGPAVPSETPTVTTSAGPDLLAEDAFMTQQMSTPNASGPMQDGRIQEPMLQRSQDAGYVRALEQHHADIDRMLARNP